MANRSVYMCCGSLKKLSPFYYLSPFLSHSQEPIFYPLTGQPLVESVCFRLRLLILTGLQAWHDLSPTELLFSLPSSFLPHLPWFTPV